MSGNKPWDRPWSMDEMIDNSDKWSLAGDVALLNTLKAFADNLITKTTEINNNLHNLTNGLDETSLQLNIARNEFQSLRNSQFIESRVYEDDETLPQIENNDKTDEKEEIDRSEDIKLAALKGLEVLDRYFDKVEVSVSDSEDDDIDLPNYILRPKDLYIDRPLPYVIGTEEWHKSWHVGLENSSSDSETEKVSDKFSESDSETDLPIIQDRTQMIKGTSDTSSEFDFVQKPENKPKIDLFNSSDSEEPNSMPVQAPIFNQNFAEQLAAKLGHVIDQEPEINKRPIQKKPQYGDLFFDEPPPLDENKGIFSGGNNLFDDDDDDIDYSPPKETKESPKLQEKTGGLFDESSDDDIFNGKKPQLQSNLLPEEPPVLDEIGKKKPIGGVSIFGGANLFDKKLLKRHQSSDEENQPKEETNVKKIDLFDDDDLFKVEKEKVINNSSKTNLFDDNEVINKTNDDESKKKISLFDDDDDLFQDDLFSSTKKKFTSGLFDDLDDHTNDELFPSSKSESNKPTFDDLMAIPDNKNSINVDTKVETKSDSPEKPEDKPKVTNSLFETEDKPKITDSLFEASENPEDKPKLTDSLFDSPEKPKDKPKLTDSLFDSPEKPEDKPKLTDGLFESSPKHDDKPKIVESSPKPDEKPKVAERPRISLFDSPPPEPDDLFDDFTLKKDKSQDIFGDDDLFGNKNKIPEPAKILPNLRLFDPSPPPDDDWDPKSDDISDYADLYADQEEIIEQKTNLFAEEPPSIDIIPKPETPTKPGKIKHNLNINVGALMPGSLPPKKTEKIITPSPPNDVDTKSSFDTTDNVEILHSVTKDRVRVPLNRRPSTRRGRKAALTNSGADFKLDGAIEPPPKVEQSPPPPKVERSPPPPKVEQSPPPSLPPIKSDLFGDDDDDDDIFNTKKPQPSKVLKKSLFDDDDDDDIFKSFSSGNLAKKPETKIATEKKIQKMSSTSVKKLENTKPADEDPLSALLK